MHSTMAKENLGAARNFQRNAPGSEENKAVKMKLSHERKLLSKSLSSVDIHGPGSFC